jgi:hypothetical protein
MIPSHRLSDRISFILGYRSFIPVRSHPSVAYHQS